MFFYTYQLPFILFHLAQLRCQFSYGDIIQGSEVEIDDFEDEEDCAHQVMRQQPSATGARAESFSCYAITGGKVVNSQLLRFCLFKGKYLKHTYLTLIKYSNSAIHRSYWCQTIYLLTIYIYFIILDYDEIGLNTKRQVATESNTTKPVHAKKPTINKSRTLPQNPILISGAYYNHEINV